MAPKKKATKAKARGKATTAPTVEASAESIVRSIARTCRGPLSPEAAAAKNAALQKGDLALARQLDDTGRTPCGYDFNETILANALDGKEHSYTCPKCGVEGSYRAPSFPVVASPGA